MLFLLLLLELLEEFQFHQFVLLFQAHNPERTILSAVLYPAEELAGSDLHQLLGLFGILPPGVSALLHNTSTLGIGLHSMTNLLPEEETCERISEKRSQSLASA